MMRNATPVPSLFFSRSIAAAALCALLGACAVGPDYERPALDVGAAYKEGQGEVEGWKPARPLDQAAAALARLARHAPALLVFDNFEQLVDEGVVVVARLLQEAPDQLELLRSELQARSEAATEEILRASGVTMHFRRTAAVDTELSGAPIKEGDKVVLWYTSANFDEGVFRDPYRFDITRDPNPHVSFGTGRHVCLGASLARLGVRVFLEEFFSRIDSYRVGEPDRLRSNFIRGIKHLPIEIE